MELREEKTDTSIHTDELSQVVEALVFGADEPVRPQRIAEVFSEIRGVPIPEPAEVERAVDQLNRLYETTGHALRVFRWAEGFRMATIPEVAPYLKALLSDQRTRRLSRSLMEALAVVAYRQPVTKPEVDFVRGVDSDYALRRLLELDMVDVVGRSDAVGRPLLYGTTENFLDKFGLDKLDDLPNLREIEELLSDPAFSNERARLLLRESLFDLHPVEGAEGRSAASTVEETGGGNETEEAGSAGSEVAADPPAPSNGNGANGKDA